MKYQECNKIVKQKAFERAIASDEIKKSVVDSLDIESMSKFVVLSAESKICCKAIKISCNRHELYADWFKQRVDCNTETIMVVIIKCTSL